MLSAVFMDSSGFNEAPAILPGKEALGFFPGNHPETASMRPRRFCRGKRTRTECSRRARAGFNEAPAILPGKGNQNVSTHGRDVRFNEAPAILPGKGRRFPVRISTIRGASMRPRRFCRGKLRGGCYRLFHRHVASMRPRRFCRGKPLHDLLYILACGLASMRPRRFCRGKMYRVRLCDEALASFNEAPAILPGKVTDVDSMDVTFIELQ